MKCKECLCLAMCLQKVRFQKNIMFSFGYRMTFPTQACSFIHEDQYGTGWERVKEFFLKEKSLI
jgi:hypothetical protein